MQLYWTKTLLDDGTFLYQPSNFGKFSKGTGFTLEEKLILDKAFSFYRKEGEANEEFRQWRDSLNLTQAQAGQLLGISAASIQKYESYGGDVPLTVKLAAAAVTKKLKPYGRPK